MLQNRRTRYCVIILLATMSLLVAPARADIAVIVHPQNTLAGLTPQELKKIFLGRLPLFPHNGREIRAIDLPDDHPMFQAFYRQVVDLDGTELKRYRAYYLFSGRGRLPSVATSPEEVLRMVSEDTGAIGYLNQQDVTEGARIIMTLPTNETQDGNTEPDKR